jgi:hypothetical protein
VALQYERPLIRLLRSFIRIHFRMILMRSQYEWILIVIFLRAIFLSAGYFFDMRSPRDLHHMWFKRFPSASIFSWRTPSPSRRSKRRTQKIYLGYFTESFLTCRFICINGERLRKGTATSRGAL